MRLALFFWPFVRLISNASDVPTFFFLLPSTKATSHWNCAFLSQDSLTCTLVLMWIHLRHDKKKRKMLKQLTKSYWSNFLSGGKFDKNSVKIFINTNSAINCDETWELIKFPSPFVEWFNYCQIKNICTSDQSAVSFPLWRKIVEMPKSLFSTYHK
jgi:hypothetical protein